MGIFQLDRRILIGLGILAIVAVFIVGLFAVNRPQPYRNDEASSYTNSITGKESIIFPDKGLELGNNAPSVTLYGAEKIFERYVDFQAASVQQQIVSFVTTLSGYRATMAGIVDNTITSVDTQRDSFRLFINKPETTFEVTVTVENRAQQTPFLTFKQVE